MIYKSKKVLGKVESKLELNFEGYSCFDKKGVLTSYSESILLIFIGNIKGVIKCVPSIDKHKNIFCNTIFIPQSTHKKTHRDFGKIFFRGSFSKNELGVLNVGEEAFYSNKGMNRMVFIDEILDLGFS